MKIYLPNISDQKIGGGWTFLRNFKKGMADRVEFVEDIKQADLMLVCGVTLASLDDLEYAKQNGIKIVFRVDNVPRKSRNKRSRVYTNMRRFAELADMVVFQSKWAEEYAGYLTGDCASMVIYNGVDTKVFRRGPEPDGLEGLRYLYVNFNRDENKRFPEAAYYFHKLWRQNSNIKLTIVGQFSPELVEGGFDFFAGENVEYLGVIADPDTLAEVYRDNDVLLFPAFADAAPNTVLEARACGLSVDLVNPVGGTKEMIDLEDISLERMCDEYFSLFNFLMVKDQEVKI